MRVIWQLVELMLFALWRSKMHLILSYDGSISANKHSYWAGLRYNKHHDRFHCPTRCPTKLSFRITRTIAKHNSVVHVKTKIVWQRQWSVLAWKIFLTLIVHLLLCLATIFLPKWSTPFLTPLSKRGPCFIYSITLWGFKMLVLFVWITFEMDKVDLPRIMTCKFNLVKLSVFRTFIEKCEEQTIKVFVSPFSHNLTLHGKCEIGMRSNIWLKCLK